MSGDTSTSFADRSNLESFLDACRSAGAEGPDAVNLVVADAVCDGAALFDALGPPDHGAVRALYRSDSLTVLDVRWEAGAILAPHEHRMWAVIGVYSGREENVFWRRIESVNDQAPQIEPSHACSLGHGATVVLRSNVIHSVTNPLQRPTAALHVYGGDFFTRKRSEWDIESLRERSYDLDATLRTIRGAAP